MIRLFRRNAHTRAKKVPVQLLKDFTGIGSRGEVVEVAEGMMRNRLHPHKGAAYVLKGQPLKIPLRTRDDYEPVQVVTEKVEIKLEEPPAAKEATASVLDFLKFPSEFAQSDTASTSETSQGKNNADETKKQTTHQAETATPGTTGGDKKPFGWQNDIIANIGKTK